MIKVEHIEVSNIKNALRGMRNPMNSWHQADSYVDEKGNFIIGKKDMNLCERLIRAGSDHRKFMRQIFVCMDITAPLYWWKEFDTYKVSTVANSTSTMHKIHSKEFSIDDFSHDHMTEEAKEKLKIIISFLEETRLKFLETKETQYWYDMIQLLPSSYNQTRTVTLNFETMINIYHNRQSHKLKEWRDLCHIIEKEVQYSELITYLDNLTETSCDRK